VSGPKPTHRSGIAAAAVGGVALLVVLALLLDLGPFGDDDPGPSEFAATADEICAEARDEFRDLQRTPPRTPGDAAELTRDLASLAEEELEEIGSLTPPAGAEADVARYLEAKEAGIELLRAGADAADAGDAERYEQLQAELERSQPKRLRLARAAGLAECSRPLNPETG
jgi:hypothetical protein